MLSFDKFKDKSELIELWEIALIPIFPIERSPKFKIDIVLHLSSIFLSSFKTLYFESPRSPSDEFGFVRISQFQFQISTFSKLIE